MLALLKLIPSHARFLSSMAALGVAMIAFASEPLDQNTVAVAQDIDKLIDQKLQTEQAKPSQPASDAEFLRRVYLDLTGVIPSAEKAKEFLDSKDPKKREKLIDELLASDKYGRHWADVWQDLLLPKNSDNRRLPTEPLTKWLTENFNQNKPWNQLVGDLVTASGDQDSNGAVTFFLANPTADKMNDTVTRLFLGVQLQCAQCHNHPFTNWKQDEYWAMATFFTRVRTDNVKKAAKQPDAKLSVTEGPGRPGKANKLPESAKTVPAKFLQGPKPTLNPREPYRPVLAKWLTSPSNPFFAKAMVNRLWFQLFGRGLVHPVDDMHDGNPASHPQLLTDLAKDFVASGFDVKQLLRTICNSQTYQRSSEAAASEEEPDDRLFARMSMKVLTPEQLYDSLIGVLGAAPTAGAKGKGKQKQMPNKKGPPMAGRAGFVAFFTTDDGNEPGEYAAGIPQALRLMNAQQVTPNSKLVQEALRHSPEPKAVIEWLFLGTLSRRPSPGEQERMLKFGQKSEPRKAYADILWALLNTSEFAINH